MWTPRRIVLALLGLLAFAAGYFGYARALGTLDGLPPLPDKYGRTTDAGNRVDPLPPYVSSMDRKFELAFGPNCPELRYPIKTEMKGKHVLIAARDFKILKAGDPDAGPRRGWVRFLALSLANFSQKLGAGGIAEINSLYADVAYLKFDKPIRAVSDLSDRHIVFAELQADPEAQLSDPRKGRIKARNNRRTLDPNDDIDMVTPGPVYYDAEPKPGQPHVYAFTAVHVTDHLNTGLPEPDYTAPREPTVTGIGMRIFMTAEDPKKKKDPPKNDEPRLPIPHRDPNPGISGVERVELDHAVEMNLWTDADASFVAPAGGPKEPKKDAAKDVKKADPKKDPKAVEKRSLQVKTNGPFWYDLTRELAVFKKPAAPRPGLIEHVVVTREGRTVGEDVLDCEVLEVQFQRKKPPAPAKDAPPPPAAPPGPPKEPAGDGDLEVKSIRATGETVVMTSDSEKLHATAGELFHDAEAHVTVLKGSPAQPVQAVKDGNLIRGSEMHLFGDGKEITQGHVLGAGSVGLGDLDPKTGEFFKRATWSDRLVFAKEPGGKDQPAIDVLTFLGKDGTRAVFRDSTGGQLQQIEAMTLKVRLKPAEPADPKKDPKRRPRSRPPRRGRARRTRPGRTTPAASGRPGWRRPGTSGPRPRTWSSNTPTTWTSCSRTWPNSSSRRRRRTRRKIRRPGRRRTCRPRGSWTPRASRAPRPRTGRSPSPTRRRRSPPRRSRSWCPPRQSGPGSTGTQRTATSWIT